jgi:hypothetical protein
LTAHLGGEERSHCRLAELGKRQRSLVNAATLSRRKVGAFPPTHK